ncbi:FMN reductase [bacterium]|nr:FMN reductase [bacterium]|tara:strand:+ start:4512 stop:5048 length:537 start_codon:yes stop_codon:yes gene_type:complete
MFIPIILGTARHSRQSEKPAKFIHKQVGLSGHKTDILDVRKFLIKETDNSETSKKAKKLAEIIKKADALIIVSPEYNHSYPGELKIMLDMLYNQYKNKPVGICAISAGNGGTRVADKLKLLALTLQMIPISKTLYFPKVQNLFNGWNRHKEIADEDYYEQVREFLHELTFLAKKIKAV